MIEPTLPADAWDKRIDRTLFAFPRTFGFAVSLPHSIYNFCMMEETEFRKQADNKLEALKKSLMKAEETSDLEVEDQSGALHVSFDDGSKFVISANSPVRQIWISALATSFKLDWSEENHDFVLQKSGELLKPLVARLINQKFGDENITLT